MKMWKKLAACVLAAAMALTLLTACGGGGGGSTGGGSVDNSFSSAAFTQTVNDKLAAKGSSQKPTHDDALKAKAEIIAKDMSMTTSEVSGMTQQQIQDAITQRFYRALADAKLETGKEDMGYLYGYSDDAMADKFVEKLMETNAPKIDKVGFAKCKIGNLSFIAIAYSYTK